MDDAPLRGRRILVVEDEYMIADEFQAAFEAAGAVVVGPVARVEEALRVIAAGPPPDGAVLDVNLGGRMSFEAADLLMRDGVPFVFTTGYDASVIPGRFDGVDRHEKPVNTARVVQTIGQAIGQAGGQAVERAARP